jgi:hypothetical protein
MAKTDAESALIASVYAELVAQFIGQNPPKNPQEGLQRIANAVGKAVIDTLDGELQINIPNITALPYSGTGSITWK